MGLVLGERAGLTCQVSERKNSEARSELERRESKCTLGAKLGSASAWTTWAAHQGHVSTAATQSSLRTGDGHWQQLTLRGARQRVIDSCNLRPLA